MRPIKQVILVVAVFMLVGCGGTSAPGTPTTAISKPSFISFGQIAHGATSAPLAITITNSGSASFTISAAPSVTGANATDFAIVSTTCTLGANIAPNQSCSVTMTFTHSTTSTETATLNFSVSGLGAQTIALSGGNTTNSSNILPGQVHLSLSNNVNALFVTVTICVPGTSNCQMIPNVEVDTGSTGLRILSSAISLPLQIATIGPNQLGNCVQFADMSYAFGPVKLADIQLAGELASNQPIQVIADSGFASTPSSCTISGGSPINSTSSLGANGLIGIGLFKQDCGAACASAAVSAAYYSCSGNSCSSTAVPTQNQLQNPVSQFSQDNNGLIVSLPSIASSGAQTVSGSVTFGINTQVNNALGTATIYTTDASGNITTVYNSQSHSAFFDSGSNGIFFLSSASTGMAACNSSAQGFYCPSSTTSFTVANIAADSSSHNFSFNIANAINLFNANPSNAAFNNLGGPFANWFDFGMPVFYGRDMYFGIEGNTVGSRTGPLYAF